MIFTIVMIVVGLVALAVVLLLGYGVAPRRSDAAGLKRRLQPLDLHAFRNLTDPSEEEYLRANLPAAKFRKVQRLRLRAAAAYVRAAAGNAAILIRIGTLAQSSPDPSIAAAAHVLVYDALRMRLLTAVVLLRIGVCIVWPGLRFSPAVVGDRYERLILEAGSLGKNWNRTAALAG